MLKNLSLTRIISLTVFSIAFIVYFFSVERTGSLWDCGEFILGAYKMQVVHPPGAPLFLLVGRIFALLGDMTSSDPSNIAFAVNLMSAICSAMVATFVASITMMLGQYVGIIDQDRLTSKIQLGGAGLAAGLAAAFCSTVWFSAVEGEVYAMSTFFTALTFWAVMKWYTLDDSIKNDKWLALAAYSAGLSIGVHLLSLLTFPALALLVYFKKSKDIKLKGIIGALAGGAICIPLIQKLIITGIPSLWLTMEKTVVNGIGLPFQTGIIPTLLIVAGIFYFLFRYAYKKQNRVLELLTMGALLVTIGYSTIGVVVIRANADTPVNMNVPSDASRLLPYINREQYGERALLFGPHYEARPVGYDREPRYGREDFPPYYSTSANTEEYIVVDDKIKPQYSGKDKILFPRISDSNLGRPGLYRQWYQSIFGDSAAEPSFMFNVAFFVKYQINWMYFRYFSWNFIGRQNGQQGFFAWDKSSGNWRSGIPFVDEAKLYNLDEEPSTMKFDEANNNYYLLPLIFGLIGLFFHLYKDQKTFFAVLILFLITGIGITLYSNQPPNEPRERDYVLVGSFFTFCIWIGLAIPAIVSMLKERFQLGGIPISAAAAVIVLAAPTIMAFENFDDHSRMHHQGSRDYASNFLNSLEPNAIIFTYGDNDTYPLWYAQEVENIRSDVRIVNLSLIQVDWYINKLRRQVNDSPALKLTIPPEAYRGNRRNQIPFYDGGQANRPMDINSVLEFIGGDHPLRGSSMEFASFIPTKDIFIPTNMAAVRNMNFFPPDDNVQVASSIELKFSESKNWLVKDELAIIDIIGSNIWDRPIYFAITCKNEKLLGLNDYMQYEGLALRLVPSKTPSDQSLYIYGSGRVAATKIYDNIMNKFKWGNFDKKDLFVDNSYAAAINAHKMLFNRTTEELMTLGKLNEAVSLTDKYFEAFPHMNFPYDASTVSFINIYLRTGQYDKAKTHLRILAQETADYLNFYDSIDPDIIQSSFRQDYSYRTQASQSVLSSLSLIPDDEFKQEISNLLGKYLQNPVPN